MKVVLLTSNSAPFRMEGDFRRPHPQQVTDDVKDADIAIHLFTPHAPHIIETQFMPAPLEVIEWRLNRWHPVDRRSYAIRLDGSLDYNVAARQNERLRSGIDGPWSVT